MSFRMGFCFLSVAKKSLRLHSLLLHNCTYNIYIYIKDTFSFFTHSHRITRKKYEVQKEKTSLNG